VRIGLMRQMPATASHEVINDASTEMPIPACT
jgi:hypothetical protein